ncbi:MAG: hypothetical protein QOG01_916 [Pseudonocardiales bacterium]|nr:hypothetical protein [Pseudonocardiales bacterium]
MSSTTASPVWPVCQDALGLDPRPVDGRAVWYCDAGKHIVSRIGELRSPGGRKTG